MSTQHVDLPSFADVDALDDRTSDASALSERRADFRARVIDRDQTCVITGDAAYNSIACHILPHAKGSDVRFSRPSMSVTSYPSLKYISNVISHRNGTDDDIDDLDDIDDTRNGILLYSSLHRPFGAGESVFLKVGD